MTVEINRARIAASFIELCEISSPARSEGAIAAYLKDKFTQLGADSIYEDDSAAKTGSDSGNLIIRFKPHLSVQEGLFFSCHMDTVEPCSAIEVVRCGDIFSSRGDTILGADDKAGIAAVIELLTILKKENSSHPEIEIVLTTCEEIGLLGAKHLDYDKIQAKYGYALDSSGIDHVVIGAPTANKIQVEINGLAAHAGLCPEAGINALALAARALDSLSLGRLDEESTCNFGSIQGGIATNIVPERVVLKGEVRSHSKEKLVRYTKDIIETFERTAVDWPVGTTAHNKRPFITSHIFDDYPLLALNKNSQVIKRIQRAAEIMGKTLQYIVAGGGSDANIFCSYGLPTAIVATGMSKVHTIEETLDLNDLVSLTELLYGLIREVD